jgi:hypothetical protein
MTIWLNDNLAKWQFGWMVIWLNDNLAKWQFGQMTLWQNDEEGSAYWAARLIVYPFQSRSCLRKLGSTRGSKRRIGLLSPPHSLPDHRVCGHQQGQDWLRPPPGTDPDEPHRGANVVKLFRAGNYGCAEWSKVFVPGKLLQPSLLFVNKAGAYPCEALFRCSTQD